MKSFKLYSIVAIVIIIISFLFSFYMIEEFTFFYKMFSGKEIDPLKEPKLLEYYSIVFNDIKIYSIFGLLTFSIMFFLNNNKQYFIFLAIFIFLHFIFIAEVGGFTIFRRLYQLLIMLPLLWIFFEYFSFKKKEYYKNITYGFLYISLLCIVLPGPYFPPFFNGIGGWTAQVDKSKKTISVGGIYLVRDDGKEIQYSHSIVNPINFTNRLNTHYKQKHQDEIDELLNFYILVYKKRYEILKKGYTPNQSILGKLAYPGHNPYGNFDYSEFPPERIKLIKIAIKRYRKNKKFSGQVIVAQKEWK